MSKNWNGNIAKNWYLCIQDKYTQNTCSMDALKEYIRQEVRDNLEGHAIDGLGIENDSKIKEFIESQNEAIEKAVSNALDDEAYALWEEHEKDVKINKQLKSYPDFESFIRSLPGDYIRECMYGLGIPGWDAEDEDDNDRCGCNNDPRCCGYNPHDVYGDRY